MEQEKRVITKDSPFYGDKLERRDVATYLTNYLVGKHRVSREVPRYRSFVLNINSEWGAGKTYFLTEWTKQLREDHHLVITFDAWKNDFSKQPLIGFMSEIEAQLRTQLETNHTVFVEVKNLVTKAKKLIKVAAPTLMLHAIKAVSGLDVKAITDTDWAKVTEAADLGDAADKVAEKIKDQLYQENEDTKQAISAFKTQLKTVIELIGKSTNKKLPLFFFVDELDRCRPDFSIELLENIKHLFGIENVYFVVATDSGQLAHSIRAVYGQGFDARAYLRRFFDQEYSLPEPNRFHFGCHLFSEYGLDKEGRFFSSLDQRRYAECNTDVMAFSLCADFFLLSLRDQDQACAMLDAIRLTSNQMTLHLTYLTFLIMLRLKHHDAFESYRGRHLPLQTIFENLGQSRSISLGVAIEDYTMEDSGGASPARLAFLELLKEYGQCAGLSVNEIGGRRNRSSTCQNLFKRLCDVPGEIEQIRSYSELVKSSAALIHVR